MSQHQVVCSGRLYGQLCQNVLHLVNVSGAFTPAQIANDVVSNYVNQVRKKQQSDFRWFNVLVRNVDDGPQPAPFSLVVDLPGLSFSSKSMPSFAAYVIKLSTDIAGKSGRGRIYVPGIHFNAIEEDRVTEAERLSWENDVFPAFRSAYLDDPNNGLTLCVRTKADAFNFVTAAQLRPVVGCMRKRNVGEGV